jgi:hypothetical protein
MILLLDMGRAFLFLGADAAKRPMRRAAIVAK